MALDIADVQTAKTPRPRLDAPAGPLRIGYLNQDFVPEVGAGPARLLEMSRRWQSQGADVTVFCGMPNRRIPGRGEGKIAAEYRGKFRIEESWDGVRTVRSWVYGTASSRFAAKLLNNLTFLATGTVAMASAPALDVVIASSPPFFPHITGALHARRRGIPLVLEVRDLWPDYLVQMGVLPAGGVLSRALFALEASLLARADLVVAVTESFRTRLIAKGVPANRVVVIPNGVDLDAYEARDEPAPIDAMQRGAGGPVVGYLGTFGRGQGLAQVVEAAALIARRDPTVRVVLAGDGPDRAAVESAIASHGVTNVTVHPPIPRTETRAFYNACDVCLVPLAPIPIFQETIPSKIFEVMACERPVIASLTGEGARIVAESEGGRSVPPGDAAALADAVLAMIALAPAERQAMGRRARAYVLAHYDRIALADRYLTLLRDVAARRAI
jgi:glycosyltransferase involved in cell wall biosynthesis